MLTALYVFCVTNIFFAKLNLKVEYPPLYERIFWDNSRVDKALISGAINTIDWEKLFAKTNYGIPGI